MVDQPWFNIAGFVQPDVIIQMLNGNDYDGFCDRQLFVCPPEKEVDYDELLPMPENTPRMEDIFRIIDEKHATKIEYKLSPEAHLEFVAYHDNLNDRKRALQRRERDKKSVLSKAKGQVLRVAAVTYALHQAIIMAVNEVENAPEWSNDIPSNFMTMACNFMDFCTTQKFALGK